MIRTIFALALLAALFDGSSADGTRGMPSKNLKREDHRMLGMMSSSSSSDVVILTPSPTPLAATTPGGGSTPGAGTPSSPASPGTGSGSTPGSGTPASPGTPGGAGTPGTPSTPTFSCDSCPMNSSCGSGNTCVCNSGFRGLPATGCTDINECITMKWWRTAKGSMDDFFDTYGLEPCTGLDNLCVNTEGGYRCEDPCTFDTDVLDPAIFRQIGSAECGQQRSNPNNFPLPSKCEKEGTCMCEINGQDYQQFANGGSVMPCATSADCADYRDYHGNNNGGDVCCLTHYCLCGLGSKDKCTRDYYSEAVSVFP